MSGQNNNSLTDFSGAGKRESAPQVIFLGSPLQFSKRFLDTFHNEFDWIEFLQVSNLSDLARLTSQGKSVAIVVVEEAKVGALLQHTEAYLNAAGDARLVVSYQDAATAAQVINKRHEIAELSEVGFLPLNVQMDVWLSVMHILLCGEVFVPSALMDCDAPAVQDELQRCRSDANLTPREWEVLKLVAAGMQNKNIASDLSLSQHTIKLHIHNILKKIGVSNRTCAASWYNSSGSDGSTRQGAK